MACYEDSRMILSEVEGPIRVWFVYIAQAQNGRYYVGLTSNLEKRIHDHNTHSGSSMAKQLGPFKLMYKSQPFASKKDARKRELQIKKWSRAKKQKLITGDWT